MSTRPQVRNKHKPNATDSESSSVLRSNAAEWGGDQVSRGAWFNAKLKNAADVYEYKTLCFFGTVSTTRGKTAVFSAEHALNHLQKIGVGTWREPSEAKRKPFDPSSCGATSPSVTSTPSVHGGYPSVTPTSAAPAPKPSALSALGEYADQYQIAADTIEEKDLDFLNYTYFLDGMLGGGDAVPSVGIPDSGFRIFVHLVGHFLLVRQGLPPPTPTLSRKVLARVGL